MKRCGKCGELKAEASFNRNGAMTDGLQTSCRACQIARNREWREHRRARGLTSYPDMEARRDSMRAYREKHQEERRAANAEWKRLNAEKNRAHRAVHDAVKAGELERPEKCKKCGQDALDIHAHHADYGAPLEVEWLCASCHRLEHLELPA